MKRTSSVNLIESGEISKSSINVRDVNNYNQSLLSADKIFENKVEIPKDENEIKQFWNNNCQQLP